MNTTLLNTQVSTIERVPDGVDRPFWSVMIPTYNCASYLVQTLKSVLSQDPGPEQMQIEVIDDCSTKDDPETVVKEVGKGRVLFYRQPQNGGAIRNFNTCIQRSRGKFVHILHGDDYVGSEFYQRFYQLINAHPNAALFASRVFQVDEKGSIIDISPRLQAVEELTNDGSGFFYANSFRTPAVIIQRKFYEESGGFDENLKHTADWEMWMRAIEGSSGIAINEPLAYYRIFAANDTSKLAKSGDNLRDHLLIRDCFSSRYKGFNRSIFEGQLKPMALNQAINFVHAKDEAAVKKNALFWWSLLSPTEKARQLATQLIYTVLRKDQARYKVILSLIF